MKDAEAGDLTFVLQVEASRSHADVRLEMQVELIGGAVQQGGHCGSCKRESR